MKKPGLLSMFLCAALLLAACAYREFDELRCCIIDIPDGQHVYRVSTNADSGEVIDVARCK